MTWMICDFFLLDDRPIIWSAWDQWAECDDTCVTDEDGFTVKERTRQRVCHDGLVLFVFLHSQA